MATIPSIGGYCSSEFDKAFWRHVEKDEATGLPIRGTLGIDYNVHINLEELASGPGISQKSLQEFFEGNAHRKDGFANASGKIGAKQTKTVLDFYNFTQGDQPYFFLRKGKKCIGLCRKTSGYIYMPREGAYKGHVYMHRVSFVFIRESTQDEKEQTEKLPTIPMTLEWVPLPKEAMSVVEIDTRAERRRLTEDLKSITNLLVNLQTRMEGLTV